MNKKGFTLVEVMIGMMILTTAIVATTQVLIGQIRFNQSNVDTLSAYYLAQEGIEAVRNIRDTNWLHNKDWLGADSDALWGGKFEASEELTYGVENKKPFPAWRGGKVDSLRDLQSYAPWEITGGSTPVVMLDDSKTKFEREIKILPYDRCPKMGECVVVQAIVGWGENKEVLLEEILTNWKDGAI